MGLSLPGEKWAGRLPVRTSDTDAEYGEINLKKLHKMTARKQFVRHYHHMLQAFFLDFLTLEDGTNRLSQNACKDLAQYIA